MDKDTEHAIIVVVVAVAVILVGFFGISAASGVNPPQTVVESGSMQQGIGSNIGVIDTGDVVLVKNKDRVEILTYVDGYKIGYKAFGNYGDVIVYDRGPSQNPVIHRAILWLDYNGNGTWSAPSLKDYPTDMWSCTSGTNWDNLSGELTLYEMGYKNTLSSRLNLNILADRYPHSGYITMGDNNSGFDQPAYISGVAGLIKYEDIKSVAWIEIPWIGTFKMMLNGKMDAINYWVPNTVPCLAGAIIFIIFLVVGISFLFDYRYYDKQRRELYEEMNTLPQDVEK